MLYSFLARTSWTLCWLLGNYFKPRNSLANAPPPHKMFNCRFALVFYEIKVQFVRFLVENIQKCTEMINITRIINSDEIIMSLYSLLK